MDQPGSANTTTATVKCDQAIFTSVRGPMGEGYRIIAATRGLKPEEKQIITRFSPSHDALCRPGLATETPNGKAGTWHDSPAGAPSLASAAAAPSCTQRPSDTLIPRGQLPQAESQTGPESTDTCAVSFYALPTGRLCAAYSCYAGAEHTGRGGQRVYTINAVIAADDFTSFGFDPFRIVWAMDMAGLTEPQLKPGNVLPEIELEIPPLHPLSMHEVTVRHSHVPILAALLGNENVVVNLSGGWLESAQALVWSIPGPMRATVAFSAGLRFSTGRTHRMQILSDDNSTAKARSAGRPIRYVDAEANGTEAPTSAPDGSKPCPAWLAFVERHWRTGNLAALARKTSRPFMDVSPPALERVGRMYNHMDDLLQASPSEIVRMTADHLQRPAAGVEDEIRCEFVTCSQEELTKRFQAGPWAEIAPHWAKLLDLWCSSAEGTAFADPLIAKAIRRGLIDSPLDAAEAALQVQERAPVGADVTAREVLLGEVVRRLAEWLTAQRQMVHQGDQRSDADVHTRATRLAMRWRAAGPNTPAFRTALDHLQQVLKTDAATA